MSHTPGPWTAPSAGVYAGSILVAATGSRVTVEGLRTRHDTQQGITTEIMANARLIAAAPDLLAACHRVLRAIDWAYPNDHLSQAEMSALLTDAIAKATGGAQ